ncbi:hypothetical protein BO86DRAFT_212039 [Aspergillus japonicus CBS 114.51]|uniref:Uncharacterized protein n=2 Tax=Aspergillus TaxID=5052 RepID=A0A2V5I331_ASPV1|nr:hypothetical protein BO86DRAFT_212039 [Aspergillus japonicus CBS 114.51]PYI22900.1 hypothetical protein BO99DRAFT_399633 [Aspergillus violaceofuscus CBS 115571]RAH85055.1 hypothetical protein BO86DRAFT_212039 [Aspergillus japonicus CBS 114.51]
MLQDRLNDAAIALHRILSRTSIHFGIFGGYAIGVLGGLRESKDIDCIASISKQQILAILDGHDGFIAIPQGRQDYVAFLWSDRPDRSHAVLVEIFCEQFTGAQYTMEGVQASLRTVNGQRLGTGQASFLDPFYLFKGKLRAAATRSKFHDSADLRWLADRFGNLIQARQGGLNVQYIGLALKRYPELELLFGRIGVDLARAKDAARDLDPARLPAPAPGDVQRGLLG